MMLRLPVRKAWQTAKFIVLLLYPGEMAGNPGSVQN